jgi:hypothetical protein
MRKLLLVAAAVAIAVGSATPSRASFTECTVREDTLAVNRLGGRTEPRWSGLKKGEKVAIRDVHQDWVFITYFPDPTSPEYGWVPRKILVNCQVREGTP